MDDLAQSKLAAQIAVEILDRAEDGTKLLAINKHYPDGYKAFSVGFFLMWGAMTAIGVGVALSKLLNWVF